MVLQEKKSLLKKKMFLKYFKKFPSYACNARINSDEFISVIYTRARGETESGWGREGKNMRMVIFPAGDRIAISDAIIRI